MADLFHHRPATVLSVPRGQLREHRLMLTVDWTIIRTIILIVLVIIGGGVQCLNQAEENGEYDEQNTSRHGETSIGVSISVTVVHLPLWLRNRCHKSSPWLTSLFTITARAVKRLKRHVQRHGWT